MKTAGILVIVFGVIAVVFGVLIATPVSKTSQEVTTYTNETISVTTNRTIANRK